jgi:hypothetical protein
MHSKQRKQNRSNYKILKPRVPYQNCAVCVCVHMLCVRLCVCVCMGVHVQYTHHGAGRAQSGVCMYVCMRMYRNNNLYYTRERIIFNFTSFKQ